MRQRLRIFIKNSKQYCMKPQKVEVAIWDWSRYRFRLFKRFMDNSGTRLRLLCFDHQCFQSLCHCSGANQKEVSVKIRIPKRGKNKEWAKLKALIERGDGTELTSMVKSVGLDRLTKRERLLLKLTGRKPDLFYARRSVKYESSQGY